MTAEEAERRKDIETVTRITDKRCTAVEKLVNSKIGEEIGRLFLKLDVNRGEFINYKDKHHYEFLELRSKVDLNYENFDRLTRGLQEKFGDFESMTRE